MKRSASGTGSGFRFCPKRKADYNFLQVWNRLSRLQRNLATLATSIGLFLVLCYVMLNKEQTRSSSVGQTSDLAKFLANDKLLRERLNGDSQIVGPRPVQHANLPDLTNLDVRCILCHTAQFEIFLQRHTWTDIKLNPTWVYLGSKSVMRTPSIRASKRAPTWYVCRLAPTSL